MRKDKSILGLLEYVGVLALGILLVYGILAKTGTIYSGYHFLDDHELLRMEINFKQGSESLWHAIVAWMSNDFAWRFRPLYWVERLTGAYLWGSELVYWNYYTAVKGVITFCCLYTTVRFLNYSRMISVIVPCVAMFGSQFTPWYRSANQESTGMMLCAITLCLIAAQAKAKKYTDWRYNFAIVAGAVLCGLVKESFTLFMPAFVGLKFWLEYWDEESNVTGKARMYKCLKSNAASYAVILIAMLINVFLIIFYVGVDNVSYAGFQEGVSLSIYFNGIKASLMSYTRWNTLIAVLILLLAVVCYKNITKEMIKKYSGLALIGTYICGVQLVAHAKSGMWERYIIPYIIGYAMLFILVAYRIFEKDIVHKFVFFGIMCLLLYKTAPTAYRYAQDYAYDGVQINQFLNTLKENTSETDQTICAFADDELNLATECWMEANDRTQIYSWSNNEYKNWVQIAGAAPAEFSWGQAKAAVCYDWQVEDISEKMNLVEDEILTQYDFGGYTILVRSEEAFGLQ